MLQELIEKAQQIEAQTDANISGAIVQVTKELDIDNCEKLFTESMNNPKRALKNVRRVREGKSPDFTIHTLRDMAYNIINNARLRQQ